MKNVSMYLTQKNPIHRPIHKETLMYGCIKFVQFQHFLKPFILFLDIKKPLNLLKNKGFW